MAEREVAIIGKRNIGSRFDEFLDEEGLLQDARAVAAKRGNGSWWAAIHYAGGWQRRP